MAYADNPTYAAAFQAGDVAAEHDQASRTLDCSFNYLVAVDKDRRWDRQVNRFGKAEKPCDRANRGAPQSLQNRDGAPPYPACEQGICQSIEPYAREIREIEEKPAETPDRATERSPRPASKRVPPIT